MPRTAGTFQTIYFTFGGHFLGGTRWHFLSSGIPGFRVLCGVGTKPSLKKRAKEEIQQGSCYKAKTSMSASCTVRYSAFGNWPLQTCKSRAATGMAATLLGFPSVTTITTVGTSRPWAISLKPQDFRELIPDDSSMPSPTAPQRPD